ncbi:MAG: oligoribonuclease [Acidimicrobiales bacterium]
MSTTSRKVADRSLTSPPVLVWMDLEMTGLNPERNVIVEIATLVTDDDLNIVAEGPDLVVHATDEQLAEMDDVVKRMHTSSGLLPLIQSSTVTVEEAGMATLDFVRQHVPAGETPLCGNSIAMDRSFLRVYLPELESHFHYRSIDVSTVKELCRRWNPKIYSGRPHKLTAHRALDDIRESVAELAFYKEHFVRVPIPEPDAAGAATPTSEATPTSQATQ